jgi:hypothetical protein
LAIRCRNFGSLEVYGAVVNDTPLTIYTDRSINPTFRDYLARWGLTEAASELESAIIGL